jgi:hypothetical protein
MRLEDLYENFGTATPERQAEFISAYRLRRAEELAKPATTSKRRMTTSSVNRSKIDLSDEEKALMKMLGLKQKDMLALRATAEVEEEDDGTALLTDNTFDEEEDE